MPQSACATWLVHIFSPLMTYRSPLRSARHLMARAGSDPPEASLIAVNALPGWPAIIGAAYFSNRSGEALKSTLGGLPANAPRAGKYAPIRHFAASSATTACPSTPSPAPPNSVGVLSDHRQSRRAFSCNGSSRSSGSPVVSWGRVSSSGRTSEAMKRRTASARSASSSGSCQAPRPALSSPAWSAPAWPAPGSGCSSGGVIGFHRSEREGGHAVGDLERLGLQGHADAEVRRVGADDRRHQPGTLLQVDDRRGVRPPL